MPVTEPPSDRRKSFLVQMSLIRGHIGENSLHELLKHTKETCSRDLCKHPPSGADGLTVCEEEEMKVLEKPVLSASFPRDSRSVCSKVAR